MPKEQTTSKKAEIVEEIDIEILGAKSDAELSGDDESYDSSIDDDNMESLDAPDMKKRKTIDPSKMGNYEESMLDDNGLAIKMQKSYKPNSGLSSA